MRTLTWDALGRLVKVEQNGTVTATYGYDSQNRRIRKTVGGRTVYYHYDLDNQLIAETLADGTTLREYVYLDGEPLALRAYETNPGLYYYLNDHLATPQQLVKPDGTPVWKAAYLPYGQAQVRTAAVANSLRFLGQYFDTETGLHYNWNRYYDPAAGRYLSPDPIGLQGGMNLYGYVQGNPVNRIDPWGLAPPPFPYQNFPGMQPSSVNPFTLMTQNNVNTAESINSPWAFKDKVQNKGDWDYKQYFPSWQDFGNYNFGAAGAASGLFTVETLLREAGKAQCAAGTSKPEWCKESYCDDPDDQRWIKEGWNDYMSGMYGTPKSPSPFWGVPIQFWGGEYSRRK